MQHPPGSQVSTARTTAQVGVWVALSVTIRHLLTPHIPFLNLGGLPILASGLLLGWRGGACVGALSDVAGALLGIEGSYIPFYTLTAALTGALPPLLLGRKADSPTVPGIPALMLAVAITQVLTKVVLIGNFEAWFLHIPRKFSVLKQLYVQATHVPVYALLLHELLKALRPVASVPASPAPPVLLPGEPPASS